MPTTVWVMFAIESSLVGSIMQLTCQVTLVQHADMLSLTVQGSQ